MVLQAMKLSPRISSRRIFAEAEENKQEQQYNIKEHSDVFLTYIELFL